MKDDQHLSKVDIEILDNKLEMSPVFFFILPTDDDHHKWLDDNLATWKCET